jgi:hypothetical protein
LALHAHSTVAQTGEYLHLGLAEGRPLPENFGHAESAGKHYNAYFKPFFKQAA